MAKVEEGCVVWGGGGGGVYLSILWGGRRIKKITMYLVVFIKIRIEARQLSVQFAT